MKTRKRPFEEMYGLRCRTTREVRSLGGTVIVKGEEVRLGHYAGGWFVSTADNRSIWRVPWSALRARVAENYFLFVFDLAPALWPNRGTETKGGTKPTGHRTKRK